MSDVEALNRLSGVSDVSEEGRTRQKSAARPVRWGPWLTPTSMAPTSRLFNQTHKSQTYVYRHDITVLYMERHSCWVGMISCADICNHDAISDPDTFKVVGRGALTRGGLQQAVLNTSLQYKLASATRLTTSHLKIVSSVLLGQ